MLMPDRQIEEESRRRRRGGEEVKGSSESHFRGKIRTIIKARRLD